MSSSAPRQDNGEGSSTSPGPVALDFEADDSSDNDELLARERERAVLGDDYLSDDLRSKISFKRKQKQAQPKISLPKFLQPLPSFPEPGNNQYTSARLRRLRDQTGSNGSDIALSSGNGHAIGDGDAKDGGPMDWYGDGPRRRVGYDDLSTIDWIYEYTKERQRLRMLASRASGFLGLLNQFWDASQIWLVLVATGLSAGLIAAAIDLVTNWLGDLKTGYCKAGDGGGRFYLNKGFCCWGLDELSQCRDWTPWSSALGVGPKGGRYVIEYIFFVLFSVVFAVCASLLVRDYAPYAKHSGIPEIKTVLGGFVIRRFMGAWTLVIKSLGLCLAVASGLWLGKEGPLVHVACCCANLLIKFSSSLNDNEARKREVLSAAASAGISVAFGAPVGGVLFSLEQLSYYFPDKTMWQSFVCAMVAAVTLQLLDPFRTSQIVLYQVTYTTSWHNFEVVPFALLGIIGGLYGGLFIKLNMKIAKWRKSSRISEYPVLEVFIVAVVTAIINFPNIFMRAQTSELAELLFAECGAVKDDFLGICDSKHAVSFTLLLIAASVGFFFAAVTFGLRIPAGIILPSMAIGALYGRTLGLLMEHIHTANPNWLIFATCEPDVPCVTPGTYALIGAASALGGVTRMTVSIVVIMFELTGALDYVLPIMIAVMLSKWVGDVFSKKGIYETWIHFNGYPFLDNRDDARIPDVPVSHVMTRIEDLATISSVGHTLHSLQEFLVANLSRGFPIVADQQSNILLGYISRTELSYALKAARAEPRNLPRETEVFFSHQPHADPLTTIDLRPWMDQTPITLGSKSTLQLTVDMFLKLGLKYVLFIERGALKGLLTKKDVWYVLNNAKDLEYEEAPLPAAQDRGRQSEEQGLMGNATSPNDSGIFEPFEPQ